MELRLQDIRDKAIVFSIVTGIFLPVRMLFYTYVSPHWIGSLGLASSVMMVLIVLSHKNKLGWFGRMFIEQMTKTIKGKTGKIAIVLSLLLIAYFGSTLIWIERGNTVYSQEKQLISQLIFSNESPDSLKTKMHGKTAFWNQDNGIFGILYFDRITSMTYAIMNDMLGGWLVNLDTILLIEQLELLGLVVIYRKVYPTKSILNKTY